MGILLAWYTHTINNDTVLAFARLAWVGSIWNTGVVLEDLSVVIADAPF